jgi:hypothetical protein
MRLVSLPSKKYPMILTLDPRRDGEGNCKVQGRAYNGIESIRADWKQGSELVNERGPSLKTLGRLPRNTGFLLISNCLYCCSK